MNPVKIEACVPTTGSEPPGGPLAPTPDAPWNVRNRLHTHSTWQQRRPGEPRRASRKSRGPRDAWFDFFIPEERLILTFYPRRAGPEFASMTHLAPTSNEFIKKGLDERTIVGHIE
jgi:hypothetical protein